MEYPGLDDAYLRYIQATPENQRRVQDFYVPFFTRCAGQVVDLACGHGTFVQMLVEHGVEAVGVDSDPECCTEARGRGLDIRCSDVIDYLQQVQENSLAGIFSAHLVEHMPFPKVMEIIRLSYRALKPGGPIVLVTPNARALYPHLESFYMHFGHVTFYHPRLLGFFLNYFGFSSPRAGENPRVARPLWREGVWADPAIHAALTQLEHPSPVRYDPRLPSASNIAGRWISAIKMLAVRLVVQPLLDRVVVQVNQRFADIETVLRGFERQLAALDRSIECYVYATKGDADLDLQPDAIGAPL